MLSALAVAVFITGCAKYTAIYTYPPKAVNVENLSDISPLKIQVSGDFSGNVKVNKLAAETLVAQQISARLYQGGAFKTTDAIWGTYDGGPRVENVLNKYSSLHGYARYVSDEVQCAVLDIKVKANMNSKAFKNKRIYKLSDVPYTTKKDKKGVPYSVPNYKAARYRNVEVEYDAIATAGKGIIEATLTDKNGNVVYKKTFPLEYKPEINKGEEKREAKKDKPEEKPSNSLWGALKDAGKEIGKAAMDAVEDVAQEIVQDVAAIASGKGEIKEDLGRKRDDTGPHEAPMTANAFLERMIVQAVEELIADVSPHQETQEIKIQSGCDMGTLLMKAQAFSEAANYLENYGKMKAADYENLGLAYEILGDYTFALEAYKKGNCSSRIKELDALKARMAGKKKSGK